jgi:hypothetical protein
MDTTEALALNRRRRVLAKLGTEPRSTKYIDETGRILFGKRWNMSDTDTVIAAFVAREAALATFTQ